MGPKLRVIIVYAVLFSFLLGSFALFEVEGEDYNDVFLYLHGDPGNATANTTVDFDHQEEHLVLTTELADIPLTPIPIGEWNTEPIVHAMNIQGTVWFMLFAKGTLQQVRFSGYLTVNGLDVTPTMTTEAQDLNESTETLFISIPVNITSTIELNNSDTVGLRLTLQHNDPQWYTPPPIGSGGKNVSLLFGGFSTWSQFSFTTNSMQITEISGEENKATGNMIVTAIIKSAFGVDDFNYATAKSDYGTLRFISEEVLDEATVENKWEWDYTVTEGGSYPVKVTARDKSYNSWTREEDVHITTPHTEVDFSAGSSSITFTDDPQTGSNTTINVKINGGGKRWSSYQVKLEFYDDSKLIAKVTSTISRAKTNIVSVEWEPDTSGKHSITVKIDPDDEISETNENNNEVTKSVSVGGGSADSTPGFEAPFLVLAFILMMLINFNYKRKK
jgi:hypothetical protein